MLKRYSKWAAVFALGWLAVGANPGSLRAQGLKVVGYGDVDWTLEQTGNQADEWNNSFDLGHFNLILVGWIMDNLEAAAEIEYEHAGNEIGFEYGYLAYTGLRNVRLVGGKFIIPFNRFNKDLHPSWVNKVPDRPLVYQNVFPATYSDVGLWVSGGVPVGGRARVVYDAYVVNGLKGDPNTFDFRDLRDINPEDLPDDNKAFGGRLGVELPAGLGIGASAYTGGYAQDTVTSNRLDVLFLGADADYRWRGLELRGEFAYGKQDLTSGTDADRKGFYAQAAYVLGDLSPSLARVEPVVRYSWVDFDDVAYGFQPGQMDSQQLVLGMNYYVASASAVRLAYFFNIEKEGFKVDNNKLVGQFTVAF